MPAPPFIPADLAPGDLRASGADVSGLTFHRVSGPAGPAFEIGYRALWDFFGPMNEVESRDVLTRRLAWDPAAPTNGVAMLYEMIVVTKPDGSVAAVRDHTAIVACGPANPCAIVHLSHNWVAPEFRGKGLAGWMRTFPVDTARRALLAAGLPAIDIGNKIPITLVAEMEHPARTDHPASSEPPASGLTDCIVRLKAYEKAGFRCVDPTVVPYHQPDFRDPVQIDSTGGPRPLPFRLIVRRVGREHETELTGHELRRTVELLYTMYATNFRASDMRVVEQTLEQYPSDDARVKLVFPTIA